MAYMQCPECKLTVPATATYLRGDQCPRCLTTMEPRDRFRAAVPTMSAPETDRATLIATSDPEESYEVADRILVIDHHSLVPAPRGAPSVSQGIHA